MTAFRGARLLISAAAAWLVFVIAFVTLTGDHWWWRFLELLPPLAFVAVPVVLLGLVWLIRTWRGRWGIVVTSLAALALGADLAGFNLGPLWAAKSPAPQPPAAAIRLFSWNTEYWHHGADPQRFYTMLREQDADVYLLQEYLGWDFEHDTPRRFDDLSLVRWYFPGYHVSTIGELLTLSRFPIVAERPLEISGPVPADTEYPEYYRYKVLRTDIDTGYGILSAYNVHMPVQIALAANPLSQRFWQFARQQHERRLDSHRVLRDDVSTNPHPSIIAGDFNATAAMGEMRLLAATVRDAAPAGGSLYPASWRGLWRLDWAFTTPGIQVHDYSIVDHQGLSDHRPQILAVSLG